MAAGWLLAAYEEHGEAIAARQYSVRQLAGIIGKSRSSAHRLIRYVARNGPPIKDGQISSERKGDAVTVTSKAKSAATLGELIEAAGVDLKEWRVARWLANHWTTGSAANWQIKAWLERRRLADVRPVQPVQHRPRAEPTTPAPPHKVALFIPDTQHGFTWGDGQNHRRLVPMHDRRAIDCATLLAEALQPSVICLLGDHLDFCEFSSYPSPPEHRQTTEPAIFELHWQLAQLRLACPSAEIHYLEGNHEARTRKALDAGAEGARHLRPADDPHGAEILSVKRLLALDSLDIKYHGPYGASLWLWPNAAGGAIQVTHGQTVRGGGGKTAAALLASGATHHQVYGHIHRLELVNRTVAAPMHAGRHTSRTITAMSPGCLARLDGSVPGSKNPPDWQQGVGVAYLDAAGQVHMHTIPIHDGRLFYNSHAIQGRDRAEEIAEDIGYPQIAAC